jgi:hypothetical protein
LLAPLILHLAINIPFWQHMSMALMAHYVPAGTVKLLCIGAPLCGLFIIDAWKLVSFLSLSRPNPGRRNQAESRKE